VQRRGHELKLVYPQPTLMPTAVAALADQPSNSAAVPVFEHWLLQPMDGPLQAQHTRQAIAHCQAHPRWRLSVQTHKVLEIR
jgi:organic radical activating enzyme